MILAIAGIGENIGRLGINVLAVAGAGAVGYGVARIVIWLLLRGLFHKTPPKHLSHYLGLLAGVACVLLAFFALFKGSGAGGGWGFGPGWGLGTGGPTANTATQPTAPTAPTPPLTTPKTQPEPPEKPEGVRMRIRLLGGTKVQQGRFYTIEGEGTALSLAEIKTRLSEASKAIKPLREVVAVIGPESVSSEHPAVKDLETATLDRGLKFYMTKTDTN